MLDDQQQPKKGGESSKTLEARLKECEQSITDHFLKDVDASLLNFILTNRNSKISMLHLFIKMVALLS